MNYKGYKLSFSTAVHFGDGSLEDSQFSLKSDTLFSALCHEAAAAGEIDGFVELFKNGKLKISDAFPYIDKTYYVPKPMIAIQSNSSSEIKKKAKKLEYIPANMFNEYLNGNLDIYAESDKLSTLGKAEIRTMASVFEGEDTRPYSVGTYRFNDNCGLYVITAYENEEDLYLLEDMLISLSFSGIGGKRSSGLGKFELMPAMLPKELVDRLTEKNNSERVMLLSNAMCSDEEMNRICEEARYIIQKRSGFVSSATYSEKQVKKQDFYCFKSGSVFNETYNGIIKDVSVDGTHPVYRYAMPIFMEAR